MEATTIAEVKAWLDGGRDFDLGVNLYSKYGRNKNLNRYFAKYNKDTAHKLAYELCKLVSVPHDGVPAVRGAEATKIALAAKISTEGSQSISTENSPAQAIVVPTKPDSLHPGMKAPKVMLDIWEAYKAALKQKDRAKGAMAAIPEETEHDPQRNDLATEISRLGDEASEARALLVAYKEKGELPPVQENTKLSTAHEAGTPSSDSPQDDTAKSQAAPSPTPSVSIPATLPEGFDLSDKAKVQKRITTAKANMSRDKGKGKPVERWEVEIKFLQEVLDGTVQL